MKNDPTPSVSRSYMESFTIHGLSKVFTGKPWERFYWLFILVGALGFVLFKVYGFHRAYISNEYRTEIRMVDTENLTFPDLQFFSEAVEDKKGHFCYKNKTIHGDECDDIQLMVYSYSKKFDYGNHFVFPISCVTINAAAVFNNNTKISDQFYVTTIDDLDLGPSNSPGFSVGVGHADEEETWQSITPGKYKIVIENVQIINRLKSPFKSNCTNGGGDLNIFSTPYTRYKCKYTLLFHEMLEKCGDVPDHWRRYVQPHHKREWDYRNRSRTDANVQECLRVMNVFLPDNDFSRCPLPCREVSFESKIVTEDKSIDAYAYLSFYIKYQSMRVTEISEVPIYTSDNFFSDVGSWLGLLVGMSFLSLVELLTFICTAFIEKFL